MFFKKDGKKTPATRIEGMAIASPSNNVRPRSAPNKLATAVAPGCGGRNPCVTDNGAAMEIASGTSGCPETALMVKTSGASTTNPAL